MGASYTENIGCVAVKGTMDSYTMHGVAGRYREEIALPTVV